MAAPRLTETEVHAACASIAAQGERPTSLNLLDKLGRGSLTTIGKYLASWNASDEAKDLGAETLPAIVKLPAELTRDGEDLIKKIWSIAKGIADEELDIQRDALKQAELATHSRVDEACKFSEAQAMKIERLEDDLLALEAELTEEQGGHAQAVIQLNEAEKANVGLAKDNDQLQTALSGIKAELAEEQGNHAKTAAQLKEVDKANVGLTFELNELKKQIVALEDGNKAAAREKQDLLKEHAEALKQKDADIRTFDNQVHELQTTLESVTKSNEQLKADLKNKESELAGRIIDIEKVTVRYETALAELDVIKTEFKAVTKTTTDAEKQVANLKGQLEVYKSLEKLEPGKAKKTTPNSAN
jgi:chromosome segregation ATPase